MNELLHDPEVLQVKVSMVLPNVTEVDETF